MRPYTEIHHTYIFFNTFLYVLCKCILALSYGLGFVDPVFWISPTKKHVSVSFTSRIVLTFHVRRLQKNKKDMIVNISTCFITMKSINSNFKFILQYFSVSRFFLLVISATIGQQLKHIFVT